MYCRRRNSMIALQQWWRSALGLAAALLFCASARCSTSVVTNNYDVGSWIWASETHDQQLCRFWRKFEIPEHSLVIRAILRISADNTFRLFLDGREIGRGGEWADLTEYDLTLLLNPGDHVLAVEAFNNSDVAGLLFGLRAYLSDGRIIAIDSDQNWKLVPLAATGWVSQTEPGRDWPAATVVGPLGIKPWGFIHKLIHSGPILPVVLRFWQTGAFQITVICIGSALALLCLHLLAKLRLHVNMQNVVRRERSRIARDIHDDVSAELTELRLLADEAQALLPPGSEPAAVVQSVCEKMRQLSRSISEIVWMVNSQRDTFRNFVSFVCKYAEVFLQPAFIRCRLDIEEMPDSPCDLGVRRNLFLAVKEALNNAVRHSQATEITLRIRRQGQDAVVSIEDNGKGFDLARANRERDGVASMKGRARDVGGDCAIVTREGAGCRVTFTVPLAAPDQGAFCSIPTFRAWWRAVVTGQRTPESVNPPPAPPQKPSYEPARLSPSVRS
jgi:signal transduction histidine kinase